MSDTPHSDSHSSRENDASRPSDAEPEASPPDSGAGGSTPADDASRSAERPEQASPRSPEERASASGSKHKAEDVPPEKAPPKQPAGKKKTAPGEGGSPAAKLKGLQKEEQEKRRGILARSKRLQSVLTSNRPLGVRNMLWATLAVLVVIAGLLAASGRISAVARSIADSFRSEPGPEEERTLEEVAGEDSDGILSFAELSSHPDNALQPYFAGAVAGAGGEGSRANLIRQFRDMLDLYEKRMGTDDNFTMRIIDGRTDTLLEVAVLEEERQAYIEAGRPEDYNWDRINSLRRQRTRELVDKWVARGIPQDPIQVKWGRGNETRGARRRDAPFIEYEIRLARFLGKSLLMTEIGTVETFNHDTWVSPVNAKSRYQMMPALLSEYGVHRYRLQTSAGNSVLVAEEQHPLISMEPSFKHAAASINAVGHEVPGVSAYHTGVGNIYTVLQKFLNNAQPYLSPGVTTMDAYMWAVTEGFEIATRGTTFGNFSRQYVVSAYGALKAVEDAPIDTSQTMLADRMQLASGQSIALDELLNTLAEGGGGALNWSAPDSLSLYARFSNMNRHFHLPQGPNAGSDSLAVGVPERGNVRLTATSQGEAVRFFLPPGARRILRNNGYPDLIDESSVFQFNHDTYTDPANTQWDRQYAQLIDEIRRFGFTNENRQELARLAEQFEQLAQNEPSSHYRAVMRDVIAKHRRFWQYGAWEDVAQLTRAALGRSPAQPQQPEQLPTQPLETPSNIDGQAGD